MEMIGVGQLLKSHDKIKVRKLRPICNVHSWLLILLLSIKLFTLNIDLDKPFTTIFDFLKVL